LNAVNQGNYAEFEEIFMKMLKKVKNMKEDKRVSYEVEKQLG